MENKSPEFGFNVLRIFDSVFFAEEAINPGSDTLISYGLGFYVNIEENWVQYNVRADFSMEQDKPFVTGTVVTRFGINNLKSFVDDKNNILWPPNALEIMFGIAFSHMRALLAKNVAGTKFSNFIVPLVNPAMVFKQIMEAHPEFEAIQINDIQKPENEPTIKKKRKIMKDT